MRRIPFLPGLMVAASVFAEVARGGSAEEFFERRIRPVLAEQCYACHSGESGKSKGGLRLDGGDFVRRGGESGPAVVAGDPGGSRLIRAITYADPDLQMPPKTRLPSAVVDDFRRWVTEGAVWPAGGAGGSTSKGGETARGFDLAARRASHWAWEPVGTPSVPAVAGELASGDPVDRFLEARRVAEGVRGASETERRVLLRRVSFALTGLPPTPEELAAFEADGTPGAFERVVDRLLASPHFGERWARHWLDKMRYAETMGHEFDYPIAGAWRYRDYVIRAFNGDVPYDQFAREQVAGDLLESPRVRPEDGGNESSLGTLQYWLCQQSHSPVDVRNAQVEMVDNQIDVVTKAFLGLTVSCARCHDHKFDAISTRDYYALFGMLSSSRYALRAVDDPKPRRERMERLRGVRERLRVELSDALSARLAEGEGGRPDVVVPEAAAELRSGERRWWGGDWLADGEAFAEGAAVVGQPVWLGGKSLRVVSSGWWHSASLSRRFQGALRSPTITLDRDFVHIRLAGQGTRWGLVVEGFTLIRAPIYGSLRAGVQKADPHWVTLDVSMWKGRRAWLEFADQSEPDPASELGADTRKPEGWVAVGDVVVSEHRAPPAGAAAIPAPTDPRAVLKRWRESPASLSAGELAWLNGLLAAWTPEVARLREWETEEAELGAPVWVAAMVDGTGLDEPVFIRGNPRTTGERVPRRFLEALSGGGGGDIVTEGSGRRVLAEGVTARGNPFFSRVQVNWVWSHLFGRGLVGSVDNFGVLGERPTHRELLDWLAGEFERDGYSTKRLIRRLVLTRAWRMSSRATDDEAERRDPDNRWWHRANLRRLEGEAIRDAMLAVSGRLDRTVGGPPVPVHLTPFMDGRGRPSGSGPLDGAGRRSIYGEVRRNFLPPFLLAFDLPVPAMTVGRRSVSNVPAQALAMMNDPFVSEQARRWAERRLAEAGESDRERVEAMYLDALCRRPTAVEVEAAVGYLRGVTARGSDAAGAWAGLGHALLNTKEFLFVE